ncbi:MAG: hypothetical protein WCH78_08480 [Bacteroidota bacterium]
MFLRNKLKALFDKHFNLLLILLFGSLIWLYFYTALKSFGYDDEYYNIRLITENNLSQLIKLLETSDVHPPLAYVFNYLLFKLTNNWSYVRLFSTILYLASLLYLVIKTENKTQKILLILLLGFNPTVLLWGTSIRWYAYAAPLLIYISVLPDYKKTLYWIKFFSCFLVFAYMEYVGVILMMAYFLYYWLEDKTPIWSKIKRIFWPGFVFMILYIPQLYIFFTIHRKNNVAENQQTFDLKTSIISTISSNFSNQGVFPLSIAGIISIIGAAILFLTLLIQIIKRKKIEAIWISCLASVVLFLVTGLAGKVRNLILLEPARNLSLSSLYSSKKNQLFVVGILCLLVGNTVGVKNVLMHQQTTKNSWNIPFDATMKTLERLETPEMEEVYFTHSPTFTYHFTQQRKQFISLYSGLYFDSSKITTTVQKLEVDSAKKRNCTFILTYRGNSIHPEHFAAMLAEMEKIKSDSVKRINLGYDDEVQLKRRFFPDYPEYGVRIIKYYGAAGDLRQLHLWEINP